MTPRFRQLADNLWELEGPVKAPGLKLQHRMSVIRLASGGLWIHSPVEFDERIAGELAQMGHVAYLVAPNRYHDMHWAGWFQRFPEAAFYCVPGLREEHPQLPFQNVLEETTRRSWEAEVPKLLIRGMPKMNEFVFVHSASRTLLVADLVFNLDPAEQNAFGKLFLRLNGVYGRMGYSRIFRRFIKDRDAFRESITALLALDFDRVLPGHGRVVETGGKEILREAFAWV